MWQMVNHMHLADVIAKMADVIAMCRLIFDLVADGKPHMWQLVKCDCGRWNYHMFLADVIATADVIAI